MNQEEGLSPYVLPFMSAFVAILAFLALQDTAYLAAGGGFEYPLTTPYLHLALADQIRAGGMSFPDLIPLASSLLYPVMLLPQVGADWQHLLPFWVNMAGTLLAATVWGRILWQSGYGTSFIGLFLALFGPLALHLVGVGFIGTEHILHIMASLMIMSGLLKLVDYGRVSKLLLLGVFIAPLIRVEGLILSVLAALLMLGYRRISTAILLLILALVPSAFIAFRMSQSGIDLFTTAWIAAVSIPATFAEIQTHINERISTLLNEPTAIILMAFIVIAAWVLVKSPWRRPLVAVTLIAALIHLAIGSFGGAGVLQFNGVYIVIALASVTIAAAIGRRSVHLCIVGVMGYAAFTYGAPVILNYPNAPAVVALNNAEISRLAKDHLQTPIATSQPTRLSWSDPDKASILVKPATPDLAFLGTLQTRDITHQRVLSAVQIFTTGQDASANDLSAWVATLPDTMQFVAETPTQ